MGGEKEILGSSAWPILAVLVAMATAWTAAAGLSLHWQGAVTTALCCLALEALSTFYRSKRPDRRLATALTLTAQLLALAASISCLSYAATATGGELWDQTFMDWDRALGLDWLAYLALVDGNPALGTLFAVAYSTLLLQMVLVALVLGFRGQLREGREFVTACVIAGIVTIVLFGLMPALGIFHHLGLKHSDLAHINPVPAYVHIPDALALRDGSLKVIALDKIEGIIPFPSFHAALGVLFARAFWSVPVLRWPALAVNLLMIAATPIQGGHYFVDVLAGIVVALAALFLAARLTDWRTDRSLSPLPLIGSTRLESR